MHNKKGRLCFLIFLILILYLVSPVSATNRLINFQGRLTDHQGNPLDGAYNIKFSIYPSSDPNAGPLWTEEHSNVNATNGVVNVLLGSIQSFDHPVKITFVEERYLGITIDCDHDPNTEELEMTPMQKILPAIYSYDADKLDGKDSSEFTTPQTDAGRPGVVENLYEGNTRLVDKYAQKSELDWSKIQNIPSGFADGTDNINDGVSNPSGTYNSMRVGYASSAGTANNANSVNGLKFSPLRGCCGRYPTDWSCTNWPSNWSSNDCQNMICSISSSGAWQLNEYGPGSFKSIAGGTCN